MLLAFRKKRFLELANEISFIRNVAISKDRRAKFDRNDVAPVQVKLIED